MFVVPQVLCAQQCGFGAPSRPCILPSWLVLSLLVTVLSVVCSRPARAQDSSSWATQGAAELTSQARAHAARGDLREARRRLHEALALDGSHGPAYLLLGRLREEEGDPSEALRVYSVSIERVHAFSDGFLARAALWERLGHRDQSAEDLHRALALRPDDSHVARAVMTVLVRWRAWPAALQLARTEAKRMRGLGDETTLGPARTQIAALGALAGELDAVLSGRECRAWQRQAIAAMGRRLGGI